MPDDGTVTDQRGGTHPDRFMSLEQPSPIGEDRPSSDHRLEPGDPVAHIPVQEGREPVSTRRAEAAQEVLDPGFRRREAHRRSRITRSGRRRSRSSDEAGNRTQLRSLVRQIDEGTVNVAPSPAFRRVVALDDRMVSFPKVGGGVPVRRVVAAAHVAAASAQPEMDPTAPRREAFLAAARAGHDSVDGEHVRAGQGALLMKRCRKLRDTGAPG